MKKIPENITCLSADDLLEAVEDVNDLNCFRCEQCRVPFATDPDVRFPVACPNCGEKFIWKDKADGPERSEQVHAARR